MTTELEEKFFKVFGIKPKWKDKRVKSIKTYYTEEQAQYLRKTTKNRNIQLCYPEITDRKLLELICILNKEAIYGYSDWGGNFVIGETVEELKESILKDCIRDNSKVFKQIQQLFKEGE